MAWAESVHEEIEDMFARLSVPTYDVRRGRHEGTHVIRIKSAATSLPDRRIVSKEHTRARQNAWQKAARAKKRPQAALAA